MKRKIFKKLKGAKENKAVKFLYPTKWKLILAVFFYFSNYITFFGIIINYPIFYFYWNYTFGPFGYLVLFIAHLVYIYLLSCIIVRLFT